MPFEAVLCTLKFDTTAAGRDAGICVIVTVILSAAVNKLYYFERLAARPAVPATLLI